MMSRCSIVRSPNEIQLFHSLNGIQRLAETRRFKAWFLEQFGVLHDGKQPYPGAITTFANPDFVTVEARALRVMPGTLAAKYEKLGGEVKLMGRPGKIIYEEAMKMAGLDATDAVAVGDSLHHDIKGANAAGIESAFISCGIHAAELGLNSFGEVADVSRVQGLASKFDARPSFVLPAFIW
ncbi:hypothetical protein CDL15_Pgr004271 [Punica granatum]|uniref:Uncharacterized protein n=1 Tax=Punica granatum TaxID=22663 RepID=A0A218XGG2_PUNGR|nr:hypothetical protein CDL15_Pgr004271 [Punica granatum]